MNGRFVASVAGAVLLMAGVATAQPGQPPPPPPPPGGSPYYAPPPVQAPPQGRQGFLIGFGIGGGEIISSDCEDCESLAGFAFDFSIGGMLNPNLGIMYDAFGVIRVEDGLALTNATNTVA